MWQADQPWDSCSLVSEVSRRLPPGVPLRCSPHVASHITYDCRRRVAPALQRSRAGRRACALFTSISVSFGLRWAGFGVFPRAPPLGPDRRGKRFATDSGSEGLPHVRNGRWALDALPSEVRAAATIPTCSTRLGEAWRCPAGVTRRAACGFPPEALRGGPPHGWTSIAERGARLPVTQEIHRV